MWQILFALIIKTLRSISIYFNGYEISVELRRPEIYLIWDGIMNFKLEIASDKRAIGLCGNNNGDPKDDFMSWYGDILIDCKLGGAWLQSL